MPVGVDSTALGATDAGDERASRRQLCTLQAWCVDEAGHRGDCSTTPREPHTAPDFGPDRIASRR